MDQLKLAVKITLELFNRSQYREQIRSISLMRKAAFESYNVLNTIREHVQKTKKLKSFKETVEGSTSTCLE